MFLFQGRDRGRVAHGICRKLAAEARVPAQSGELMNGCLRSKNSGSPIPMSVDEHPRHVRFTMVSVADLAPCDVRTHECGLRRVFGLR